MVAALACSRAAFSGRIVSNEAGGGDLGLFAECMAGPDVTTPPSGCDPMTFDLADFDTDSDVDLADFAVFQPLLSGL